MFMNFTCPMCGGKCRIPEAALGSQVQCSFCMKLFNCPKIPGQKEIVKSTQEIIPTIKAKMIHYKCPKCKTSLEAPIHLGGTKQNCHNCGQRLQIPFPDSESHKPKILDSPAIIMSELTSEPKPKPKKSKSARGVTPSTKIESCLECGNDLTGRQRILTCPNCGSLFCSAGCFREHSLHAHPERS